MPTIRLEVNLIEGLERCRAAPGPHRLFVPAELTHLELLADLVLSEQRGYLEVELDVTRRKLAQLKARHQNRLATCSWERDLLTGQRMPIAPDLWRLERDMAVLETRASEYEGALAVLDKPEKKQAVMKLLGQFEIYPRSEWPIWQTKEVGGILIDLVTYGYGLVKDPEQRLEARRLLYSLSDQQDWD